MSEEKLKLYRLLLRKYADLINEKERRTIGEIKSFVNPMDLTVHSFISDFIDDSYSYEKDFLKIFENLLSFLREKISFVEPDLILNYWLTPEEILREGVADDEDFAILVCTCALSLGNSSAEILICELDDLSTRALVSFSFNNKFYLVDPFQNLPLKSFSGEREKVIKHYSLDGKKISKFLYRFNNSKYEHFGETDL